MPKIRLGARTGGALVTLGLLLLAVGLVFADSVGALFRLFPLPVLGVILFFAGLELGTSASGEAFLDGAQIPAGPDAVLPGAVALGLAWGGDAAGIECRQDLLHPEPVRVPAEDRPNDPRRLRVDDPAHADPAGLAISIDGHGVIDGFPVVAEGDPPAL